MQYDNKIKKKAILKKMK